MTVVADPFSRLTFVTVVSPFPVCDVFVVVEDAAAALSGNTIVVVSDCGAAGEVWAAAGRAVRKRRLTIGTVGVMFINSLPPGLFGS